MVPLRGHPTSASFDGTDQTVSLAHELEALTGSASPVKRLDDTREEIQSAELDDMMKNGFDDEEEEDDKQASMASDMHKHDYHARSTISQGLGPSTLRHRRKPCSDV